MQKATIVIIMVISSILWAVNTFSAEYRLLQTKEGGYELVRYEFASKQNIKLNGTSLEETQKLVSGQIPKIEVKGKTTYDYSGFMNLKTQETQNITEIRFTDGKFTTSIKQNNTQSRYRLVLINALLHFLITLLLVCFVLGVLLNEVTFSANQSAIIILGLSGLCAIVLALLEYHLNCPLYVSIAGGLLSITGYLFIILFSWIYSMPKKTEIKYPGYTEGI